MRIWTILSLVFAGCTGIDERAPDKEQREEPEPTTPEAAPDGEALCLDYVTALACGDVVGTAMDCPVYGAYDCDLDVYFACLADHTVCADTPWIDVAACEDVWSWSCIGGAPTPSGYTDNPNVTACEAYLDSLECGDFDFGSLFPEGYCGNYVDMSCDVTDYFDCLREESECDEQTGVYTPGDCAIPECA